MTEREGPASRPRPSQHTVGPEGEGQRLDNYLIKLFKGVPKTRLYKALRKGEIRVNKGRVKADYRLCVGDVLRLPPLRQAAKAEEPRQVPQRWAQDIASRVVYEDEGLLVIDKPSGLAVHGGSGLSFGLIESLRQLRPHDRYLELVHRLDRDTSGLILIARKRAVLTELHRLLREDQVDKRYIALVLGNWPQRRSLVDAPLEKNVLSSGERMVRVMSSGRRSKTEFSVLERLRGATLVEAKPITGRTHQIRVHARHVGCPLIGDEKYGDVRTESLARDIGLKRLFLHAASLRFSLPHCGRLELSAGLDNNLENILEKLRK
ncbi:MAG: RluA family pseudouridine synthase [Pseudomonadota bacterium]